MGTQASLIINTQNLWSIFMISFSKFISERFVNLIGDDPRKSEHAQHVKDMLDKSYKEIGGIHGSGFHDTEDMKKNIPMWKLKKEGGKITAAVLYKDKNGRKLVAVASDGSKEGKRAAGKMVVADLTTGRAYGEQSSNLLASMKKHVGSEKLSKHIVPYHHVHHHLDSDDEIRRPPDDDPEIMAHPEYKHHSYQRKIGGAWHTKIMLGTPGKKIVNHNKK